MLHFLRVFFFFVFSVEIFRKINKCWKTDRASWTCAKTTFISTGTTDFTLTTYFILVQRMFPNVRFVQWQIRFLVSPTPNFTIKDTCDCKLEKIIIKMHIKCDKKIHTCFWPTNSIFVCVCLFYRVAILVLKKARCLRLTWRGQQQLILTRKYVCVCMYVYMCVCVCGWPRSNDVFQGYEATSSSLPPLPLSLSTSLILSLTLSPSPACCQWSKYSFFVTKFFQPVKLPVFWFLFVVIKKEKSQTFQLLFSPSVFGGFFVLFFSFLYECV